MGSSFTALISNCKVSSSLPPLPSLVAIWIAAALVPFKLDVGVKVIASKAMLICANVPLNTIALSLAPSPVVKLRLDVPIEAVPPVIVRVTVWLSVSASVILISFAIATLMSSSLTVGAVGNEVIGAVLEDGAVTLATVIELI